MNDKNLVQNKNILINPYISGKKLKNFPSIEKKIDKYYDLMFDTIPDKDFLLMTPRYQLENGIKVSFRDIFYYIDLLYDNNPKSLIDVGCGECVWKRWFPNLVGFDPTPSKWASVDFIDYFDKDFSNAHHQMYNCGMALNSIHSIDWNYISTQINLAMNLVSDRFLFTFNFNVMTGVPKMSPLDLILSFNKIINSLNYNVVMVDYPLLREVYKTFDTKSYGHLNGHARFMLEHKR